MTKSKTGYCIKTPSDNMMIFLCRDKKNDCIEALIRYKKKFSYLELTWEQLERLGYRCVKARVSLC